MEFFWHGVQRGRGRHHCSVTGLIPMADCAIHMDSQNKHCGLSLRYCVLFTLYVWSGVCVRTRQRFGLGGLKERAVEQHCEIMLRLSMDWFGSNRSHWLCWDYSCFSFKRLQVSVICAWACTSVHIFEYDRWQTLLINNLSVLHKAWDWRLIFLHSYRWYF